MNGLPFLIANVLLVPHIAYGGYFILSRVRKTDPLMLAAGTAVGICLILMMMNTGNPLLWQAWLCLAFIFAILFHTRAKTIITKVSLIEFCNYKIFIEAYGIMLCLIGISGTFLFPGFTVFGGIVGILFILRLNWLIFMKKKLYALDYPDPVQFRNPLVSIVVIAYNEEKYIAETLKSITSQTYRNFEVILVDDKSTDATVKIAEDFRTVFPLQIMQKDIRGCARSRNFGAAQSKGELILFLDADVTLPADFLEKALQNFYAQKLSIAYFDFIPDTDAKIDFVITSFYRSWLKVTQYFNPRAIGSCIMVDRKLHERIRFDETILMSEDFDYVRRAVSMGKYRMQSTPKYRVSWRRFGTENRLKLILKYLAFEFHRQMIGEIRKPIFSYEFGHYDREN